MSMRVESSSSLLGATPGLSSMSRGAEFTAMRTALAEAKAKLTRQRERMRAHGILSP